VTREEIADRFRKMADQIEANKEYPFGGAFVMVPPQDLEPVELLILDTRQNAHQFYANIKTLGEERAMLLGEEELRRKAYGVR
jgi:hypothetical protein